MQQSIQDSMNIDVLTASSKLYDIPVEDIKKIGGFENFVYEYKKDNSEYILRFVHSKHRTFDLVMAELEFIDYLSHNNAPVSTVIHSINDQILEKIKNIDNTYFSVSSFSKAPGTYVKRNELTNQLFVTLGTEIGRLHKLTKSFNPVMRRDDWDKENYLDEARNFLPVKDDILIEKYKYLVKKINNIDKTTDNFGLIHTDLHFGNMYIESGKLTFFDFDDASYKHFISDVAVVLFYQFYFKPLDKTEINTESKRILANLLKGYSTQNHFDYSMFEYLNDFIRLRIFNLYFVLYATGTVGEEKAFATVFINRFREMLLNDDDFLDINFVTGDL